MREALHASGNSGPAFFTPLTNPILEYSHGFGETIIGGFIYRGSALDSSFQGKYFFADYISAKIASIPFSLTGAEANSVAQSSIANHTSAINISLVGDAISGPISVTPDANGEIMICDLNNGALIRLIP